MALKLDLDVAMGASAAVTLRVVVVSTAACALAPPATSASESAIGPAGCSLFYCGDNAASAGDGLLFDEFDLFHRPNYAGVRMLGASWVPASGGTPVPLTIDVVRHTLRGIEPDGTVHEGGDLVGTIIKMEYQDAAYSESFELLISDFQQSNVTFLAGDPEYIPSYEIKARRRGKEPQKEFFHVCNRDALVVDPLWTGAPHAAVIFRGDRYIPGRKQLMAENDPDDGWSFLACAGSAGAKMHLFRHTHAGAFDASMTSTPFMTTPDQRTTLLKTITADYCGDGSTFTINGQPLAFTAAPPFGMPPVNLAIAPLPPPVLPPPTGYGVRSHEAIWNAGGAICIDHPRREVGAGPDEPRWSREKIEATCGRPMPSCGGVSWWPLLGYSVTANPW